MTILDYDYKTYKQLTIAQEQLDPDAPRNIAVLTSGGDAPGMNPVIRAVVRSGRAHGFNVFGIIDGYDGLINDNLILLGLRSVSDIIDRGGTILRSARSKEFMTEQGLQKALDVCHKHNIDGLVLVGGDGTYRGAGDFTSFDRAHPVKGFRPIQCIGIPGTIDNDIGCTDYTIGFDTTLNTVVDCVDRIRDTAESHSRCFVVEIMGNGAGYLTLYSGIACGATSILIPEKDFDIKKDILDVMDRTMKTGKKHFVIAMAEGVKRNLMQTPELKGVLSDKGIDFDKCVSLVMQNRFADIADEKKRTGKAMDAVIKDFDVASLLAEYIQKQTGVDSRGTVLAHVQRGGNPSCRDRLVGSEMGSYAVDIFCNDDIKDNRVVAVKADKIVDINMAEALEMKKRVDLALYDMSLRISI